MKHKIRRKLLAIRTVAFLAVGWWWIIGRAVEYMIEDMRAERKERTDGV